MFYGEDFLCVKVIIMDVLCNIFGVLDELVFEVGIEIFDSYNIIFIVCFYVELDDYWGVIFDVYQCIKSVFYINSVQVFYFEGIEFGLIGN